MKVAVRREELDLVKYGWYVKEYVLKFLKDNHMLNDENKDRLEEIKIYAENLKEQNIGRMCNRSFKNPPEIAIDVQFFDLKTMTLKEQNKKVIFSQIIHEMLHQISSYKNQDGEKCTGIIKDGTKKYTVLNEGFTQMITERITGFILSPDNDRTYTYYKNIAKIIADTIGEQLVFDSYFKHNNSIDNLLNYVAKDSNFFESLSKQMAVLNCKTIDENILNNLKKLIIKKICSSIIVPKLKSLSKNEQTEYLKKIQNDLKNDDVFLKQLKKCTNKFYKLNDKQLSFKRMEIEKILNNYNMLINVNTLNFKCGDVGLDMDYLFKQINQVVSFNINTCKIEVDKELKYKYREYVYTYTKNQTKCLIESRENLKNKLYNELYINKYLVPKLRKKFRRN